MRTPRKSLHFGLCAARLTAPAVRRRWRAARYGGPQPFMEGTAATSLSAIMQMLEDMVSTDTAPSLRTLPHGKVFTTFIGPAGARIQVPWYYPFVCVLLRRLPVSAPAA